MEALFKKHFVVLCALGILVLSIMPGDNAPDVDIPYFDKIAHLGIYTVLSGLLYGFCVRHFKISKSKMMIAAFLSASAYGVLMEILQHLFFESRSFEFYDIISNIMGSLLGILFVNIFFNSKK